MSMSELHGGGYEILYARYASPNARPKRISMPQGHTNDGICTFLRQ